MVSIESSRVTIQFNMFHKITSGAESQPSPASNSWVSRINPHLIKKVSQGAILGGIQGATGLLAGVVIGAIHGYGEYLSDRHHYNKGLEKAIEKVDRVFRSEP